MKLPLVPTTSPTFRYVRAVDTDITKTLIKHGWVPPDRAAQANARMQLNNIQ